MKIKNKLFIHNMKPKISVILCIIGCILCTTGVKRHLISYCKVSGRSMEPNLYSGMPVLTKNWNLQLHRGDIIVINDGMQGLAVKRIIGLPFEHIVWNKEGIKVNNKQLSEPYIPKGVSSETPTHTKKVFNSIQMNIV